MDVRLVGHDANAQEFVQIDPTYNALRASLRPIEYKPVVGGLIGGHFRLGCQTGTMTAGIASAAQVFQVWWNSPTKLFLLKLFKVQCATGTGFAATTLGCPLELIVGHGATSAGSGGTAITLKANQNRMRQDMGGSELASSGEIRVASVGAVTAAGGQVLESSAIGECMGAPNATLAQSPEMFLFDSKEHGDHPLTLVTGDTLVVRTLNPAATGTWYADFTMAWAEVANY